MRVGYARVPTRRAPGYKKWHGGIRRVRGPTRRIAIAAFRRSVPDLHQAEAVIFDTATSGTTFFSNAFNNPGAVGVSGSNIFLLTHGIQRGTDQHNRIGNEVGIKYLNFTLTLGINNGGTQYGSAGIPHVGTAQAPFTIVIWLQKDAKEGTITPNRAEVWDTTKSGNMPKTWVRNKDREVSGTIVFQKTIWPKFQDQGIYWDPTANAGAGGAVRQMIMDEQTWKFNVKCPNIQTTWTAATDLPQSNHYYMWIIRNKNFGAAPYTSMAATLLKTTYFSP